ncbi:uncharacterized protein LACBIDRAFT_318344 [Laccaria bicolor S238N-H82]|uniref:Predicted protein n=1 Tax=Laccaria bicolor (strain S238N-H82 / ATCC MYA-4686) TaxID=486041 RepID=B0D6I8_LACBS|nr:uncharacterized protein LACBIDRAFT_318344 [Laccaria bicolor S238N-H82]EDR10194.1 predicted protein [Laccaria bicolor S238N-H82]|eukprot:XP_001879579.1 predicted protein [Laccaria bicolor S238N-H82]
MTLLCNGNIAATCFCCLSFFPSSSNCCPWPLVGRPAAYACASPCQHPFLSFHWHADNIVRSFPLSHTNDGFHNIHQFPIDYRNETAKGLLVMPLKELKRIQDSLAWPKTPDNMSIVAWAQCEPRVYSTSNIIQFRGNPISEH